MTVISTVLITVILYQCKIIKSKRKFIPPKTYHSQPISKANFAPSNLYPNPLHAFPQTSSSDIFDDGSYEKPVSSKRFSQNDTDDDDDDDDDDDVLYESVKKVSVNIEKEIYA